MLVSPILEHFKATNNMCLCIDLVPFSPIQVCIRNIGAQATYMNISGIHSLIFVLPLACSISFMISLVFCCASQTNTSESCQQIICCRQAKKKSLVRPDLHVASCHGLIGWLPPTFLRKKKMLSATRWKKKHHIGYGIFAISTMIISS